MTYEGIQDHLRFWILRCGWILDSSETCIPYSIAQDSRLLKQNFADSRFRSKNFPEGAKMCGVTVEWFDIRGVLLISCDWNDQMGAKFKTQKNPWGFQQNLKKSVDQNLTGKKSHAKFPSHKNFQKALNDITWKIETLILNTQKIKIPT